MQNAPSSIDKERQDMLNFLKTITSSVQNNITTSHIVNAPQTQFTTVWPTIVDTKAIHGTIGAP